MLNFINKLKSMGCRICTVYTMDAMLLLDVSKYVTSLMIATSVMVRLESPHITVLTKYDLLPNKDDIDLSEFAQLDRLGHSTGKLTELEQAIEELVEEYSMVGVIPLDITDEDTVSVVLTNIDMTLQWGEDEEPEDPKDMDGGDLDDIDM
eukprot:UN09635